MAKSGTVEAKVVAAMVEDCAACGEPVVSLPEFFSRRLIVLEPELQPKARFTILSERGDLFAAWQDPDDGFKAHLCQGVA